MHPLLSQDWTTIRGAAGVASLTQGEQAWLDLSPFQDIVTWLEVKDLTPTSTNIPTLAYQTAPTKDDALFFNLTAPLVVSTGVTTTVMLKNAMGAGCPPPAKWFRWQIAVSGGVAWDLTFRLWIAANRIGRGRAMARASVGYAYGSAEGSGPGSQDQVPTKPPPHFGGYQGGGRGVELGWIYGSPTGTQQGSGTSILTAYNSGDSGHQPSSGIKAG